MEAPRLQVDLTVAELNLIIEGLAELPFRRVAPLVLRLKADGERQLRELTTDEEAPPDTARAPSEAT